MNSNTINMTPVLIRTIVKKALEDIKEAPERNTRNLVDMALHFSHGRFQKRFLGAAQNMLHNEQSAYYKLVQDLVLHSTPDHILDFGMNVGYNSCTLGASIIRKTEQEKHFNIPWCLTFITDLQETSDTISIYQPILEQGKELGIYTWIFFSNHSTDRLLPLIQQNKDCAFVIFCSGTEVTNTFLENANALTNLMVSISYDKQASEATSRLRENHLQNATHLLYSAANSSQICNGSFLESLKDVHPAFTFFLPDASCSLHLQEDVYQYICDARNAQQFETLPFDLLHDNLTIDSIISEDACSAGFDSGGNLFCILGNTVNPQYNIYHSSLSSIFQKAFPKNN